VLAYFIPRLASARDTVDQANKNADQAMNEAGATKSGHSPTDAAAATETRPPGQRSPTSAAGGRGRAWIRGDAGAAGRELVEVLAICTAGS